MASVLSAPFLVAPSEKASTPAAHVSAAGAAPNATNALARRAVEVHPQVAAAGLRGEGLYLVDGVDGAEVGGAGDRHD